MPKLFLLAVDSIVRAAAFELKPGCNTLGRAPQNDVVLPSIFVSRQHAELHVEPPFTTLVDLGSQNGSFVNGQRVERQTLVEGDLLRFGSCELQLAGDEANFGEVVEARGLSSVPHWLTDGRPQDDEPAPTAPDRPPGAKPNR